MNETSENSDTQKHVPGAKKSGWDATRLIGAIIIAGMGAVVLMGLVLLAVGVISFTGNEDKQAEREFAKATDTDKEDKTRPFEGHVPDPLAKSDKPDDVLPKKSDPKADDAKPPNLIMPFPDKADFLGSVSEGRRFCIIADNSDSMAGAQMTQLTKEIMRTLTQLKPTSQFYVIFFNKTDFPMPHPNWLFAEKENIEKIRPWVEQTKTKYGTQPHSAFERAFKLDPRPDCIFFMTDGILQARKTELAETLLTRLNAGEPKVKVNTILFTRTVLKEGKTTAAMTALRRIAEKNAGTFRYVSPKSPAK